MARNRFRPPSFRPPPTSNTLFVVLRNKAGLVGHVAVGSAILDADWRGALSMLPSGEEAEGLADFFCDTPSQAERAMDELAEIGDVPFHPRDFPPKWFSPRRGSAAVGWLLASRSGKKARRVLTDAVCLELERVQQVLEAARRPGYRFHFVELEPGEDVPFAGPSLRNEPENNQMQRTSAAQAKDARRFSVFGRQEQGEMRAGEGTLMRGLGAPRGRASTRVRDRVPPSRTRGRPARLLRSGLWSRLGSPGLEAFALWEGRGFTLEGTVVTAHQSKPVTAWYRVRCDGAWRTREVRAGVTWVDHSGEVRLQSDGQGRWLRDGREVRAIRGCTDIDLELSPSTNTLPIRRLGLAIGQSSEVAAAWLRFPGLTLEPLPQRYTRLDRQRYRYESRGGSFTAELTVDELGLVVAYGGVWQRIC